MPPLCRERERTVNWFWNRLTYNTSSLFIQKNGILTPGTRSGDGGIKTPKRFYRARGAACGELWIEQTTAASLIDIPYRFTGKELDSETGLYYYGARYLDPKASRWISGDPAMGEYLPAAPVNEEARKQNQNLPGQGGVFNVINLHAYHYAGNNPIKYTDP
ncbi:MAG: RHS repeat-associated core domain-containing protein, partial [Treponema sp.]|nr:RHS repeat-associated core domain-containing protein [Treponema sp.]